MGCSCLRVFHEVTVQMLAGLHSSEGLTGARGPVSNMAHSCCWQEVLIPPHMGLTIGLLECAHDKAAGFPREERA